MRTQLSRAASYGMPRCDEQGRQNKLSCGVGKENGRTFQPGSHLVSFPLGDFLVEGKELHLLVGA